MRRVIQMLATFLAATPMQTLTAQGLNSAIRLEGQKVRVRVVVDATEARGKALQIDGTVASARADSIQIVEPSGRFWSVPVSNVETIDINRGKDHWRGAAYGAGIGAVFGLVISMMEIDCNDQGYGYDCKDDGSKPSTAEYVQGNVVGMMYLGAMLGAWNGVQRWERVGTGGRVAVAAGTGGVGLRIKF